MDEPVLGELDVIVAIREWLLDDPALSEATAGRIFGHELPDAENPHMPRACVVVADAGGFSDGLPEAMDRARVDAKAYGASVDEAKRIAVLVRLRMKVLTRAVRNGIVIFAPSRSGSYIPLKEPLGGWRGFLRSYLVPFAETEVA